MVKEQMPKALAVVLAVFLFVAWSLTFGADANAPVNSADRALEMLIKQQPGVSPPEPRPTGSDHKGRLSFTSTDEMQAELGRVLYDDYVATLEYNGRVFEWQLSSSRKIFWVVLGLVATGIIFSGLQFCKAFRARRPTSKAELRDMQTELEISTRGLRVSSSVIGVIILVISLAFLYLFLIHVYPVEYVRTPSLSVNVSEGTK